MTTTDVFFPPNKVQLEELEELDGDERETLLQTIAEALTIYGVCVDEMLYEHLDAVRDPPKDD
ncbi:MAG: hypothetical protein Q8O67_33365 [Deltaproteobacteria bacterium]|nr:hypothetical protein [Deltaproteobacteria bacterium]